MRISRPFLRPFHAVFIICFIATIPALAFAQTSPQNAAQTPLKPAPQPSANWDDAVRTLAARIANLAGRAKTISFDVNNISSITSADVASIRQSLQSELTRRRFRLAQDSETETQIIITLSAGVNGYIWVAQLRTTTATTDRIAMIAVRRIQANSQSPSSAALVLEKRLIWQQVSKFLDFAILPAPAPAGSPSTLVILETNRLAFYSSTDSPNWLPSKSIPIPNSNPWPRDPRGSIAPQTGDVYLANAHCLGNLADPENLQCAPAAQAQPAQSAKEIKVAGHEDAETALLSNPCGDQSVVLSTGNGDWTQPDSVQGYLLAGADQRMRPSGDPLQMDGPVISLLPQAGQAEARAVVLNLKTSNYEAYVITANCAH